MKTPFVLVARFGIGAMIFCVLATPVAKAATVLYSTGFESPAFSVGTIQSQDGWTVHGDPSAALVVSATAYEGSQCLRLNIPVSSVYALSKRFNYSPLSDGVTKVVFHAEVWPGTTGTTTHIVFDTDSGYVLANFSRGIVLGSCWDKATSHALDGGRGTCVDNGWNDVSIAVDYAAQQFEITCSGTSLGVHNLPTSTPTSVFKGFTLGGMEGPRTSYVDEVSVSVVPEPTAIALLLSAAFGGFLCLRRRRSQNATR
jgi:hypothetical protein